MGVQFGVIRLFPSKREAERFVKQCKKAGFACKAPSRIPKLDSKGKPTKKHEYMVLRANRAWKKK